MAFDPVDIKNKPVLKYLSGKKVLVVGTNQILRSALRSFMKVYGVGKILNAGTLNEAMNLLEDELPEIIITEFQISGKQATPLIVRHRELIPNRLNTITIFVGETGLSPAASKALDEDVDIFVVKPFTVGKLDEPFISEVVRRLKPSEYDLIMDEVNSLYIKSDYKECLELINELLKDAPSKADPYALKGNLLLLDSKHDEASLFFKEGLKQEPTHYKCLRGLYEYYVFNKKHKDAYDTIDTLLKHHPFNPNRLPEITKVFIANEKFRDVIRYCDKYVNWDQFDNMDDSENKSEIITQVQTNVSACMIVSAKFLIKEKRKKEAVDSLKKAALLGQSNIAILSKVIELFTQIKQYELAEKWINKVPFKDLTNKMKVSKLEIDDSSMGAGEVLTSALLLLENGVVEEFVYEIVIKRSIEIGRREEAVGQIINDAIGYFPDAEIKFKNFIKASL